VRRQWDRGAGFVRKRFVLGRLLVARQLHLVWGLDLVWELHLVWRLLVVWRLAFVWGLLVVLKHIGGLIVLRQRVVVRKLVGKRVVVIREQLGWK
jgi:hypothetical protein